MCKLKEKELGQEAEIKYKLAKAIADMYSNVKEPDEIQSYRFTTGTAQSEPGKLPVTSQRSHLTIRAWKCPVISQRRYCTVTAW